MKAVLLVNDNDTILTCISEILETIGSNIAVFTAHDGKKAIEILNSSPVHLIVTDLRMPVMDGYELVGYVKTYFPQLPVLVMSGDPNDVIQERLQRINALENVECVENPLSLSELAIRIIHKCGGPANPEDPA